MIEIREATKAQASDIARLIMMAMTDDCCLHFCGVGHGLEGCICRIPEDWLPKCFHLTS